MMFTAGRCFHLHCTERVVPVLPDHFKLAARGRRTTEAMNQVNGIIGVLPCAKPGDDLTLLAVCELEGNLDGGAGIEGSPTLLESRGPP